MVFDKIDRSIAAVNFAAFFQYVYTELLCMGHRRRTIGACLDLESFAPKRYSSSAVNKAA